MHLARLDNEVFFKKAFTDRIVFKAFVKDILGIEVDPDTIETEKRYGPKMGDIDFRYDIFAEDIQRRVIVEIQQIEYDYHFDRFLLYHLQAITEQQRSSTDYTIGKTVYTIVVMTAPYKMNKKTGEFYHDEVLISSLNPRNLKGIVRPVYNHELIFLNPNYKGADTPVNYRDWLDLIYESIHSPENPSINRENAGVRRASELIEYEQLTGEEIRLSKIEVQKRQVIEMVFEEGEETKALKVARKMVARGDSNAEIAELTELTEVQIEAVRREMGAQ
jgi:hypothetical protein